MGKFFEIKEFIEEYPNHLIHCVIGARGVGKSYSTKRLILEEFLEYGKQALILRRYKNQAESMATTYFTDVLQKEFPTVEYELKGDMGFINGEPFCLFTGLNGNSLAKGSSFPNVYYIIYEEVMPEPGEKIIKDEYKKLESIIVTVDRFEDRIEVICVGNNTSYYNPIFDTLKLYPSTKPNRVVKNELMAIKTLETPKEFKEYALNSKVGKLTVMSGSSRYNIDNENISNDRFNVCSKKELWDTDKLEPVFKVRVDVDKVIKIWKCQSDTMFYYWVDNHNKGKCDEYFLDLDYQTDENKHISLCNKGLINRINFNNKVGAVFFNNAETKFYFNQIGLFFKK